MSEKPPIHVLLIEDNEEDVHLIRTVLSGAEEVSISLETVAELSLGEDAISTNKYDVVLLDLRLPDSTAMESVKWIRDRARRVPIVVLTAVDDRDMALQALREGAQDYLNKSSLEGEVLLRSVLYAVERHRLQCELEHAEQKGREELEHRVRERTAELAALNEQLQQEVEVRKRAEEEARLLASVPEEGPSPILRVSPEGRVLYSNDAAQRHCPDWNCQVGCLLPQRFVQCVLKSFELRTIQEAEFECGDRVFSILFSPQPDAGYVNLFANDITKAKIAEEALREAQFELEERVRERTNDLTATNAYLKKEIEERKQAEAALRVVVEGTASTTGDNLFRSLVHHLASSLEVRHGLICRVVDSSTSRVRTLAFWNGDDFVREFEYSLQDTPCERVVAGEIQYYPKNLQNLFPHDSDLVELNAQSYLGIPLMGSGGDVIGHLAVLDDKPMSDEYRKKAVLRIFASRAAAELERLLAEQELRKLSRAVEQSPASIVITDPSGVIEYVNPKFTRVTGYTFEEAVGQNPRILKSENTPPERFRRMWEAINAGKEWRGEFCNRKKNGELYWELASISPITDSKGHITHYVAVKEDITERKQTAEALEKSEKRFRLAQAAAHIGVWEWDVGTGNLYWSDEIEPIFGFQRGEFAGTYDAFLECVHPDDRQAVRNAIQASLDEDLPYDIDHRIVWHNGTVRWVNERASITRDERGMPVRMVGTVYDITQRKTAEESLLFAKEEAERANRAKSEFLSRMSHELRTPMNSILGFSQLLESDPTEPLSPIQKESVTQILKAGNHLLELINEILDLSRIESGRFAISLESVRLGSIVQEVMTLIGPVAEQYGISVNDRTEPYSQKSLIVDRTRLKQVLINLLSNAVKYNRPGGAVTLSCENLDEGRLRICVSDTGHGIPPAQVESLFEPFNRLGAERTEVEGTGIGLTIAKRLMDLMAGNIGVQSEVGKGSTFYLDVDISRESVVESDKHRVESAPLEPLSDKPEYSILYVEDNPDNVKLVSQVFAHMPWVRVLSAADARLGIDLARAHRPDLILLDITLPGMDGFAAFDILQSDIKTKDIPVIGVSAKAMPDDVDRALNAGFSDYLTKPIDINRFREVVNRFLAVAD